MLAKPVSIYFGVYTPETHHHFSDFPCAAPLSSLILMRFSWKTYKLVTHLGKQLDQRPGSPVKIMSRGCVRVTAALKFSNLLNFALGLWQ